MKRRELLIGLAALPLTQALPAVAAMPPVLVYKNPSCGCCGAWVDHMKAAGFAVTVGEVADTAQQRERLGLPARFGSCHTATVAGYVLEGHVPAGRPRRRANYRDAARSSRVEVPWSSASTSFAGLAALRARLRFSIVPTFAPYNLSMWQCQVASLVALTDASPGR